MDYLPQIVIIVMDIALGALALKTARTALEISRTAEKAAHEARESTKLAHDAVLQLQPRMERMEKQLDALTRDFH